MRENRPRDDENRLLGMERAVFFVDYAGSE